MATKRKRDKKCQVTVTHEDFVRMNKLEIGLTPIQAEAAAKAFAALRNLHETMGPGCEQRAFDMIAMSLPRAYRENWIQGHLPKGRPRAAD